jgi:hypothetical protein
VSNDATARVYAHVRPMDFTGRPMKGMIFADTGRLDDASPTNWVEAAAGYARGLPPKQVATASRKLR